jgi:hypothetical protein
MLITPETGILRVNTKTSNNTVVARAPGPGALGNRNFSSLPRTDRLPDGDVEAVPDIDVGDGKN